jgi:hypothetical protein
LRRWRVIWITLVCEHARLVCSAERILHVRDTLIQKGAPMKAFLVILIVLSICDAALAQQPASRPRAETPPPMPRPLICDPLNLLPGCHITGQSGANGQPVELYIWDKIVNAALPDLQYASALAASAGTPSAGVRKQCWDALITANKTASGIGLKDANGNALAKPDQHLFVDVEQLAEVIDNLAPTGPLFTACAGAAQLARTNTLTFINAIVTGAAGLAALGIT